MCLPRCRTALIGAINLAHRALTYYGQHLRPASSPCGAIVPWLRPAYERVMDLSCQTDILCKRSPPPSWSSPICSGLSEFRWRVERFSSNSVVHPSPTDLCIVIKKACLELRMGGSWSEDLTCRSASCHLTRGSKILTLIDRVTDVVDSGGRVIPSP